MRALVTGASGFIGKQLVSVLLSDGHDVKVVTRNVANTFPDKVEVFIGDITDLSLNLSPIVENCSLVFNCAGEIKNEKAMRGLHIDGTKRLLEAFANQNDISNKHWVQLSSVGAYGPSSIANASRTITENTVCNPVGEYESTKTIADDLITHLAPKLGITYTILRPSNVVGTQMANQSFFRLISSILQSRFFYIGSKESIATYVHIDDVVSAILLCGTNKSAINQTFNLSNDCKLSEIVEVVMDSLGKKDNFLCISERLIRLIVKVTSKFRVLPLTEKRVDALVSKTTYPYDKIKNELGFKPQYAIPNFVASYLITTK